MNEEKKPVPMSAEKRTALLRYMSVLFAVAFILVLLSYLIQAFKSQTTIDQLNTTSASALQNAERLQETNRELSTENHTLSEALNNAQACIYEYQESINSGIQDALAKGHANGKAETQEAYDLLLAAIYAKDPEQKEQALASLEPLKAHLSEQALLQYYALLRTE